MRKVINISLPPSLASEVEKMVKEGKFATRSEFFRDLLRKKLEGRLLEKLKKSREEIISGKGKLLTSLDDLE